MIDRREILEAASSFSLLPSIVEKDYVLGWVLAGIWVDGFLSGQEIRESLQVRDWQRAQEIIREWEIENRQTQSQQTRVTIVDAHKKFMSDAEARKLNQSTLYKYRLLFRHLDSPRVGAAGSGAVSLVPAPK